MKWLHVVACKFYSSDFFCYFYGYLLCIRKQFYKCRFVLLVQSLCWKESKSLHMASLPEKLYGNERNNVLQGRSHKLWMWVILRTHRLWLIILPHTFSTKARGIRRCEHSLLSRYIMPWLHMNSPQQVSTKVMEKHVSQGKNFILCIMSEKHEEK